MRALHAEYDMNVFTNEQVPLQPVLTNVIMFTECSEEDAARPTWFSVTAGYAPKRSDIA